MEDDKAAEACIADFYDPATDRYLICDAESKWVGYTEPKYRRELVARGLGKKVREESDDPLSQVERAMRDATYHRNLKYSGLLSGWAKGIHVLPGVGRILVTEGPRIIEPVEGDWPLLHNLIHSLLGNTPRQAPTFLSWLKLAVESLRSNTFRPGQCVAFCGPKDCGKSLLQNLITEILGGQFARPYLYMSGKTEFNREMFEAVHLVIEDDQPSTRIEERRAFGNRIKEIVANEGGQRLRAMYRDGIILPVLWRMTISVNSEPENLLMLPPMDDSMIDKIIVFLAQRADIPNTTDSAERKAYRAALTAELPALVHYLLAMEIPEEIRGGRFGVLDYHHPEILQTISDLAPENKLKELVDGELFGPAATADYWEGTAAQLERVLMQSDVCAYEARRMFKYNTTCGTYLGRLAKRFPRQFASDHKRIGTVWTIRAPEGDETTKQAKPEEETATEYREPEFV